MTRYLRWLELNEGFRGIKTDRHITDRFLSAYDLIYDSDDYIPDPDAVRIFAETVEGCDYDLIYCDEDIVSGNHRKNPFFKPDYSPETERSLGYISGMAAVKKGLDRKDLSHFERDRVCHIDKVLYHRSREKGVPAKPEADPFLDKTHGKISVILLSKDHPDMLERCVATIRESLVSVDTEIILVDNGSNESCRCRYEEISLEHNIRYFYNPSEFNYPALNNYGVSQAGGDIFIFMNDDIEIPSDEKGILERLAAKAMEQNVGAVGIKLLYPDKERIQHCGVTLLYSGPSHKLQGYKDRSYYHGYSDNDINVLAVTGACLAVSRKNFETIKGFDASLPVAYNDVDLCMRLYEAGLYNVCVNSHRLIHYESATRTDDRNNRESYQRLKGERLYFTTKHQDLIDAGDPFISRNLTHYGFDFDINLPEEWELAGLGEPEAVKKRIGKNKRIHCALDSFDYMLADAYGNEDFYELVGWIFKEGDGRTEPCVVLETGDIKYVVKAYGMRRKDVGEAFPKEKHSAESGFVARVSASEIDRIKAWNKVTAYPAIRTRHGHIYKGYEECQIIKKI